jgi:RNA polymerase sigma factor (TIGR02999 family)
MSRPPTDVTTLLGLASQGDRQAQEELFRLVEGDLRKRAKALLRRERPTPSLQTTVLVDEAFLRLVADPEQNWENRSRFYCCAARVMREIIVDEARRRAAEKRGGGEPPAPLDRVGDLVDWRSVDPLSLLVLHEALGNLAGPHPQLVQIVELHHFGGWQLNEIAEEILHIPYPTVKQRWQKAKALLHRAISGGAHDA